MKARQLGAKATTQLELRIRSAIAEGLLCELPHAFVGVEFGCVAGEALEVEPREGLLERSDGVASVNRAVVPEHDHGSAQVAKHVAEEVTDLRMLDVLGMQAEVQPQAPAAGTDGQAGDHRDAIPTLAVVEQRCLSPRRPGAPDGRDQEEARLVDEDEVGAQPAGFFLMRGQVSRFHCSILASSRSSARRSGFCTLHPSPCSSRPTWARW